MEFRPRRWPRRGEHEEHQDDMRELVAMGQDQHGLAVGMGRVFPLRVGKMFPSVSRGIFVFLVGALDAAVGLVDVRNLFMSMTVVRTGSLAASRWNLGACGGWTRRIRMVRGDGFAHVEWTNWIRSTWWSAMGWPWPIRGS